MVAALESLQHLNAEQLRELSAELIVKIAQQSQIIAAQGSDILYRQAKVDKLTHELATLKRWKFGRSSELLNGTQISLIEKTIEADIAANEQELQNLAPISQAETNPRQQPKRAALAAGLPRVDIHHEPDSTTCGCGCQLKRIGQDVSEKLDCTPSVFTVGHPYSWQADLCPMRNAHSSTGTRSNHRQRYCHCGLAGPGASV